MFDLKKAADAAVEVRKAVAALNEQRGSLVGEMVKLQDERDKLYRDPVAREDVKQFIFDSIDHASRNYLEVENWASALKKFAYPKRDEMWKERQGISTPMLTLTDVEKGFDSVSGGLNRQVFGRESFSWMNGNALSMSSPPVMCFFFGDMIKSKIDEHFDSLFPPYHDLPVLRVKDRYVEIARIDGELAQLKAEVAEVDTQLRQLGVSA